MTFSVLGFEVTNSSAILTVHAPDFDLSIVARRHNQGKRRMEGGPIDTAIMSLKDKLDHHVSHSKHVMWWAEAQLQLRFVRDLRSSSGALLPQSYVCNTSSKSSPQNTNQSQDASI